VVAAEYNAEIHEFRITPYVSAEFFYDITTSTWKQEWYTAGFEVPYRHWLKVDLYYLRQNCPSCTPDHLNVIGLTVSFFVDATRCRSFLFGGVLPPPSLFGPRSPPTAASSAAPSRRSRRASSGRRWTCWRSPATTRPRPPACPGTSSCRRDSPR